MDTIMEPSRVRNIGRTGYETKSRELALPEVEWIALCAPARSGEAILEGMGVAAGIMEKYAK